MIVWTHSDQIAQWVAERIDVMDEFGPCTAAGVALNNRLAFGVVFHNYDPKHRTIAVSFASENPMWARRENIAALLNYPFGQLNIWKCWSSTPIDNDLALKTALHIGFKREAVLADQFGRKRHAVICRMTQPYFFKHYGQYIDATRDAA